MKSIAFVYTEYQQNILFSICLQEKIFIDILFIKKNIDLQQNIDMFVRKIVYFEEIPFSWRSIWKYYQEYKKTIVPVIDIKENYKIFTWSITNPLPRYTINFLSCKDINSFEDGSASYLKWGIYNSSLGIKAFIVSTIIFTTTNILSFTIRPISSSWRKGWSLFENCYPGLTIEKNIIKHQYFQKVIEDTLEKKNININIDTGSVVFITSAYVEYGLFSNEEFIQVMVDTVKKMKQQKKEKLDTVYWKLHPRTKVEDEQKRLSIIENMTGVHFEILKSDFNIEFIALANKQKALQYYSLGSSSLYVIKALVPKETLVFLVENDLLVNKFEGQTQLIQLYRSIGIGVI